MHILTFTKKRLGWLAIALLGMLGMLLWLSPAENTLGNTVKLVYLHGALVRTAMALFAISLPVNLVALVSGRPGWQSWGWALTWAAVIIWLLHTLMSMITTYAAWGVFIAWFEPRTRFTFNLMAVSLIVLLVARLINHPRFSALVFALLAGVTLGLLPGLGLVQHPLDPIGTSSSTTIRGFYAAILLVSLGLGGLLTVWLQARAAATKTDSPSIQERKSYESHYRSN
ncbi:MAG: hypothetical protein Kow0031_30340 [Anaerolineae bacterium]